MLQTLHVFHIYPGARIPDINRATAAAATLATLANAAATLAKGLRDACVCVCVCANYLERSVSGYLAGSDCDYGYSRVLKYLCCLIYVLPALSICLSLSFSPSLCLGVCQVSVAQVMKILCKHFLFLLALQRILKSHLGRRGITQALSPPPPQCNVAFKNYATMFVRQPQTKNFFGHKCFAHNLKKYLTNLSVSAAYVCLCVCVLCRP